MSMISAQIDELREMADGQAPYRDARAAMLEAADTILELRDDLQRANDALRDAEHDESCAWDRVRKVEAENAKLREQLERVQPTDCEGNVLDIADTVHMLRSEYDGDHEWEDVVTELVLTKWGGGRWIVRGSKGEAWACDCAKTGYDEDAYEASDDVEPFGEPTLLEAENAKLREEVEQWHRLTAGIELPEYPITEFKPKDLERENAKLRELVRDMMVAWWACDNERCPRHDKRCEEGKFCAFDECARDLGIEVDE